MVIENILIREISSVPQTRRQVRLWKSGCERGYYIEVCTASASGGSRRILLYGANYVSKYLTFISSLEGGQSL